METGFFIVEARWDKMHDSPAEAAFFEIDELGGSLDDAKSVAQSYYDRHVASSDPKLQWVEGIHRKAKCYYAHTTAGITFRITR